MIYIAICDDDRILADMLAAKVNHYMKENKILAECSVYTNSFMLKEDIQERKHFDLILCDIEMPEINGMSLASCVKTYLPHVLIIFITSHLKYAIDAFELSVFRYIPKEFLEDRLMHALEDAIKMIRLQSDQSYLIQTSARIEKIPYQRIVCIQKDGKNSRFLLLDNTNTSVRKSLSIVYEELGSEDFVYADRGTIINLAHVIKMESGKVHMKNGTIVLTSKIKYEQIKVKLNEFWGNII